MVYKKILEWRSEFRTFEKLCNLLSKWHANTGGVILTREHGRSLHLHPYGFGGGRLVTTAGSGSNRNRTRARVVRASAASWPERTYLTIDVSDEPQGRASFGLAESNPAENAIDTTNRPAEPRTALNAGLWSLAVRFIVTVLITFRANLETATQATASQGLACRHGVRQGVRFLECTKTRAG